MIFGALGLPVIIALYGWTSQARLPLPVLLLVVALMGAFVMLAIVPMMSYVVDAFGLYSASA